MFKKIRIFLWALRYGKPFRSAATLSEFETLSFYEIQRRFPDDIKSVVLDERAVTALKNILGKMPLIGTWEWWEDTDDRGMGVHLYATPCVCIPTDMVSSKVWRKWGKVCAEGICIPVYI